MKCYLCATESPVKFQKFGGIFYYQCQVCNVIFCDKIPDNIIVTQNDKLESRTIHYELQLKRIRNALRNKLEEPLYIVDFGCGNGQFLDFLQENNIWGDGIDTNTILQLKDLPDNLVNAFSVIEVIEHLYNPFMYFKEMYRILGNDGIIYVESSFIDNMTDPG